MRLLSRSPTVRSWSVEVRILIRRFSTKPLIIPSFRLRAGGERKLIPVRFLVKSVAAATALASAGAVLSTSTHSPYVSKIFAGQSLFDVDGKDEDFPLVYDVAALRTYWSARPLEVLGRLVQVVLVLGPYLAKLFLWEYMIRRKIRHHAGLQKKYASKLRQALTQLGPCFVKLGQALSIRPDLLSSTVLDELQKLCDSVPSFPSSDAINVIERELGQGSAKYLFRDFNDKTHPIAAASLGQVYRLKLKSNDEWVAVKVQRPDMKLFILRDLFIMRVLATVVENVKGKLTNHRPYDVALVDSFASASLNELDYIKEAKNQDRFRDGLVPRLNGRIYVPKVYHEHSTEKVLVTEWIDGEKLAQSPKEVINRLIPVGIECFLCQLLEIGYFHADPHPGNLLVTKDGKLALIDFGLCAEVPLPDTKVMTLAIVHLMQGDVKGLVLDAIELGFLPRDTNVQNIQQDLQGIFDGAQLAAQKQIKQVTSFGKFKAVASRRKKFWAVSRDLNKVFFEYPFLVPDYFALITRAMIVLEGIAVTGDPEFDIFASSYPYVFRRCVEVFGLQDLANLAKEVSQFRSKESTYKE